MSRGSSMHGSSTNGRRPGSAYRPPSTPTSAVDSSMRRLTFVDHILAQLEQFRNEVEWVPSPASSQTSSGRASNIREGYLPSYKAELACRNYVTRESLGSGSYSKVKCAYKWSGTRANPWIEKVAVKIIDRAKAPRDYQEKFLPRELEIWPRLHHEHIVQLYEWFTDDLDRRIYMVLELAPNGDCLRYVQRYGAVTEPIARLWTVQTVSAVYYMHQRGMCHRDLKLENLLLDTNHSIKLADFGFVRCADENTLSQTYCGSKSYAAPEILQGVPHDPRKADVWAVGVVLYIFITGKMPFDEARGNRRLLEDHRHLSLPWSRSNRRISEAAVDLVMWCFTFEFRQRPNIEDVTMHSWMRADVVQGRPQSMMASTNRHHQQPQHVTAGTVMHPQQQQQQIQPQPQMLRPQSQPSPHHVGKTPTPVMNEGGGAGDAPRHAI